MGDLSWKEMGSKQSSTELSPTGLICRAEKHVLTDECKELPQPVSLLHLHQLGKDKGQRICDMLLSVRDFNNVSYQGQLFQR
jgi:hypothetical protein